MDGTLVNNTEVHIRAFEIFCNRYGVSDWREKLASAFGMGNDDIMRMILPEELIRQHGIKALGDEKEALYREIYAPDCKPIAGLKEVLEELRRRGIRIAVGSSACRENVDFVLEKCGIAEYFESITTGDRVTHCKPDPEIYLTGAAAMGLHPEECMIFEDAKSGITAAHRAGCGYLVALSTTISRSEIEALGYADRIIGDYTELRDWDTILG